MGSFTDDLRLAHLLADDADSLTEARFKAADLRVSMKDDLTAVTDADKAVEESVRRTLAKVRTRDAIYSEEGERAYGQRTWIIDPIDGTANYVRGVPVWATLIALEVDGRVRVGVVSAPALGRRWWASEDDGAYTGKNLMKSTKIQVSETRQISQAFLSYSSLNGWISSGRGQGFVDLMRDSARTRAFGDFWSYMMVAEGVVDMAAEPELDLYDKAALDVIVREAGGIFTDLDGNHGPHGPGAIASNGLIHRELVDRLADRSLVDDDEDYEDSLVIQRERIPHD